MKKIGLLIVGALLLTGCSANTADHAKDLCVENAEEQLGVDVTPGTLESINIGDAFYDAEITDERTIDDADAMFTVTGDLTWEEDGKQKRQSMFCTIKFEDGEPTEAVQADLY